TTNFAAMQIATFPIYIVLPMTTIVTTCWARVVPYYEIPIYNTTGFQYLPGRNNRGRVASNGSFPSPESRILQSSSIQLTCIPDNIVVCVRKTVGNLTCEDTDSYATIKNISINFNRQAGLVSSMAPEQLYRNSVQSGLANRRWDECCGSVI
ncbi:MAG: major capsid protein V20 domain-containing protein, partial [Candidatus Fonsibacter sp.]